MHLGIELHTQAWRHVAIAIANHHIIHPKDPEHRVWEKEFEENEEDEEAYAEDNDNWSLRGIH